MKYEVPPDVDLTGFGGSYEKDDRAMLKAALEWADAHPLARPEYGAPKGVEGLAIALNEDAKALDEVILQASGGDASLLSHMLTIRRFMWIRKNGWDRFVEEIRKQEDKKT